jgi:gamma-glutamyltranspeptidase / glutathione hydrolase
MGAASPRTAVRPGVAAGHPATAEAGIRVLALGGSAADAAVAATLTSCVAESIFTGLGGGGFVTYYEASTGKVTCLDFFCAEPGLSGDRKQGPMTPVAIRFGQVPIPYEIGGPSVGVPGVPAGCDEIHRRWGRLPWAKVVAPSIEAARSGTIMQASHVRVLLSIIEAMVLDQGADAYTPGGRLIGEGSLLCHPGLADALELLAIHRSGVFYEGMLGELTVDTVRAGGGALGMTDLTAYRVIEREVADAELAGNLVLGRVDLNRTIPTLRALPDSMCRLSSADRLIALAGTLGAARVGRDEPLGNTTNVTAVDADGNACVVTTTLGLGAGAWLPGYGVHLNSMRGEGELNDGDIQPGDRISSMMCPLIVLDPDSRLRLALGSAGGSRIRTALLATLVNVLVEELTVPAAVQAPRLHAIDDLVHLELDFPAGGEAALAAAGFTVNRWTTPTHYFGGVSAVGRAGAAGDHRRGGAAHLLPC